jgi:uncharacterized protein (TIGR02145 family)
MKEFLSVIIFWLLSFSHNAQSFKTIAVGNRVWMAENLNVSKFQNGEIIKEAKSSTEWIQSTKNGIPVWCHYNNDPNNGSKYGKIYNFYALNNSRGVCPAGWRIPDEKDWNYLSNQISASGDNIGNQLKSKFGWNENGNGLDRIGFGALPGGGRLDNGDFIKIGEYGMYWSSNRDNLNNVAYKLLSNVDGVMHNFSTNPNVGMSIRCVKAKEGEVGFESIKQEVASVAKPSNQLNNKKETTIFDELDPNFLQHGLMYGIASMIFGFDPSEKPTGKDGHPSLSYGHNAWQCRECGQLSRSSKQPRDSDFGYCYGNSSSRSHNWNGANTSCGYKCTRCATTSYLCFLDGSPKKPPHTFDMGGCIDGRNHTFINLSKF